MTETRNLMAESNIQVVVVVCGIGRKDEENANLVATSKAKLRLSESM
jgi:hypothetical protein